MRKTLGAVALFLAAAHTAPALTADSFLLEDAFPNLTFNRPIQMTQAPDGSNRIFVLERAGIIKVFPNSPTTTSGEVATYINISARVATQRDFALNSFAFHPDFATNGEVYVHYNWNNGLGQNDLDYGSGRISRFIAPDPSANTIPHTEGDEEVLYQHRKTKVPELDFPLQDHNGGTIAFGPDGYLYIAFGDGGSTSPQLYANTDPLSFDPLGNGQNTENNLGTIIRIDVDGTPDPGLNYRIPPDNPFYVSGPAGTATRKEIWAYGLRNPWRMAFNPANGDLYAVDVGAKAAEEINLILPGRNYGWRLMEGSGCVPHPDNPDPCVTTGLELPILEHVWTTGLFRSLTGGYFHSGPVATQLNGKFIYGDYVDGGVFAMEYDGNSSTFLRLLDTAFNIAGFGEDRDGEVYMLSFAASGKIWRLVPNPAIYPQATPATINTTEEVPFNGQLQATDVGGVTGYQVESMPTLGALNLNAVTGEYVYTPDNLPAAAQDEFAFTAFDADGNFSRRTMITVNIAAVNDAPAITGTNAATVTEGNTTVGIGSAVLGANDPDSPAAAVLFKVTTVPSHGAVNVSGVPAAQFTLADVNAALVTYEFTGNSNVTSADSFAVTVEDEEGVASAPATVSLTIEDENDLPVITGTLAITVTAGNTTAAIASTSLGATDPDSPASAVLFKVTTAPAHGTVNLSGSPVTQFTLADVNASLVSYAFTGDSNVTSADSFAVTVEDEDAVASAPSTINVTIQDLNDLPVITGTLAGTLGLGETVLPITASILGATDPDSPAASVLFKVANAPAHGTVNVSGSPVSQFTLADVNASLVTYVFTGNAALVPQDTFQVTVEDQAATPSLPSTVTITITQPSNPVEDWQVL